MHSFAAPHNEIHWNLVVDGQAARWSDYRRTFPVVVRPTGGDSS